MARLARVVAPGFPRHITQRGNRRQQTFSCDEIYQRYVELMAEWCNALEVEILAYCLMPNHVSAGAQNRFSRTFDDGQAYNN
jgi:putative transposase